MIEDDLENLDEWIRRLKVEYHIFFNGHRKKPPDDLRFRVEKLVKRLGESSSLTFSQRFRYNTLVARFYVFRDLWRRTQIEREQNGPRDGPPGSLPPHKQDSESADAEQGIAITIEDPGSESEKIRNLYEWLKQVRGRHAKRPPDIPYDQFADYITTRTRGIQKKFGCAGVVFRVSLREDTIKFTAKADNS